MAPMVRDDEIERIAVQAVIAPIRELDAFNEQLEAAYQGAQTFKPNKADWLDGRWAGLSKNECGIN